MDDKQNNHKANLVDVNSLLRQNEYGLNATSEEYIYYVLKKAQKRQELKLKDIFVFDLDSTLFNVSPRIQQIMHDFAELKEIIEKFPHATKRLKNLKVHPTDWGIRNIMGRINLPDLPHNFYVMAQDFWKEHFFANHYLHHDIPYEGAVSFLNKLQQYGHEIYYLTGRDQHRMGSGTVKSLLQHNFPLAEDYSNLALKPNKDILDTNFKRDWFLNLIKNKLENNKIEVLFFENEPVNLHEIKTHLPQIKLIFFDSTHSGKMNSPNDLQVIKSYKVQL